MSDPGNFLSRWSRRKRAATAEPREGQADDTQSAEPLTTEPTQDAASQQPPGAQSLDPPVDLTRLPPIDGITAETDISGFLAPGVPPALREAALRRAWVADPKIRDFVGLNDYDFDFHTPGAIPGFGPLQMTDELRREVARILGNVLPEEAPGVGAASPAPPAAVAETVHEENSGAAPGPASPPAADAAVRQQAEELPRLEEQPAGPDILQPVNADLLQSNKEYTASQQRCEDRENLQVSARRSHGGALPK
jgi:hypothetical protein